MSRIAAALFLITVLGVAGLLTIYAHSEALSRKYDFDYARTLNLPVSQECRSLSGYLLWCSIPK